MEKCNGFAISLQKATPARRKTVAECDGEVKANPFFPENRGFAVGFVVESLAFHRRLWYNIPRNTVFQTGKAVFVWQTIGITKFPNTER